MQYTILKLSLKQNDVFFWTSDRGRFGEDMSRQRLAFLYQNLNLAKDSVPTSCTSSDTLLLTRYKGLGIPRGRPSETGEHAHRMEEGRTANVLRPRCMQLVSNASRTHRGGCGTRAPRGAGCLGAPTLSATETKREHVRSAMQAMARSCGRGCAVDMGVEYARSGKCSQRRARRASADSAGNCWRCAGTRIRLSVHVLARPDACCYACTSMLLAQRRIFVHAPAWSTSLHKILAASHS